MKEKHYLAYAYFFYAALLVIALILFFIPEHSNLASITGAAIYLAPVYKPDTLKILTLPIILGIILFLIIEGFKKP